MLCGALWAQAPAPAPSKPKPTASKPAATKPAQPAAAPASTPVSTTADPVVFTAGTRKMTKSEFDNIMKNLPENVRGQLGGDTPEARRRLAEQLGEIITYAEEARRLHLNDKPAVKIQMYLQQESAMAQLLFQHMAETLKPSDADAQAYYAAHKNDYENAKARHILIRFQGSRVPLKPGQKDLTEAESLAKTQSLRDRIEKGEDFAVVAKAESDDTGSGAKGGDLGSFNRGTMVPVFDQAAFSLPVGEISQPVKSPFGFHIIQVQERGAQPLAEVRPEIEKKLTAEKAQKAMDSVKNSHKPELDETYFGKPAPPKAPAPAAPPAAQQ